MPTRNPSVPMLCARTTALLAVALGSFAHGGAARADDGPAPADGERAKQSLSPEEIVSEARKRLAAYSTIQMKITQRTHFGDRSSRAYGQYLQGTNLRSRLEFHTQVGQVKGDILQVCDGQDLWTQYTVGDEVRLTLRKVRPILQVARTQGVTGEQMLKTELGLGGLPEMIRAVEEATEFDKVEKREKDGQTEYVVGGHWSEDFRKSFGEARIDRYIPDRIDVHLDAKLFPRRIVYLKNAADGEGANELLVSLEFGEPTLGEPIDASLFTFKPPTGVFPRDLTEQYIQKLQPRIVSPPGTPR